MEERKKEGMEERKRNKKERKKERERERNFPQKYKFENAPPDSRGHIFSRV
jgi:hypothetical protein